MCQSAFPKRIHVKGREYLPHCCKWSTQAIMDISGTFTRTDMVGNIHMKMNGRLSELTAKLDPKIYRRCLQNKNSRSVMYVKLKKTLFGTLQAAQLFWCDLTTKLKSWGFYPNDWCVANKTIKWKQCTILWHIYAIKISQADSKVVRQVIDLMKWKILKRITTRYKQWKDTQIRWHVHWLLPQR